MKVLILGSTGMLGQALLKEAQFRNHEAIGIARKRADICIDITNDLALKETILKVEPEILINTVAIVNHAECENNPCYAYLVNSRPCSIISDICTEISAYYVHISTDHYFTGDGNKKHNESYPIKLLNEYARTKYIGESFALLNPYALIVRTNIVGFRSKENQPTFLEWVIKSIKEDAPITLFDDYFTSSINVTQFSSSIFDLIEKKPNGIINLACREVRSKKDFIEAIANQLGIYISKARVGSVTDLRDIRRAESIGLDVTKAENILGYTMPSFEQVISSLVNDYRTKGGK